MRKLRNDELNRLSLEKYRSSRKNPIIVVLDNVRSLNNIGSVFRTCDGFRIEKLILCGISSHPPHRDIHKTALGAEESVEWEYFSETKDALSRLKADGYLIVSVEQVENSISLNDYKPSSHQPVALVFGHEVKGVQQEIIDLSDFCIEIPQHGTKHSLNVSVSVGIVLWEIIARIEKTSPLPRA